MLNKILNNKIIFLILIFIIFIIFGIFLLNLIFESKINFELNYLIMIHITSFALGIYLFNFILNEEKSFIKSILSPRVIFIISSILLVYTIVYIIIGDKEISEKLSIYLYYSMILGVLLEIFYMVLEKYDIDVLKLDKSN